MTYAVLVCGNPEFVGTLEECSQYMKDNGLDYPYMDCGVVDWYED